MNFQGLVSFITGDTEFELRIRIKKQRKISVCSFLLWVFLRSKNNLKCERLIRIIKVENTAAV